MWDIWIPCVIPEGDTAVQSFQWLFGRIQSPYDHVFCSSSWSWNGKPGRLFDLEMAEDMATSEIAARLDEQMAEGMHIVKCPQGRGWKSW